MKKNKKSRVAAKSSFVAPNQPFFDRLDIFPNARLLKITLVLLFFDDIHYLPCVRASIGQELTQRRFSSAQIGPFLMQKSDPQASGGENLTWLQSCRFVAPNQSFIDRLGAFFIARFLKNTLVALFFG